MSRRQWEVESKKEEVGSGNKEVKFYSKWKNSYRRGTETQRKSISLGGVLINKTPFFVLLGVSASLRLEGSGLS